MYQFHCETILPKYGSLAKPAYSHTDSFIYHIQTIDLYNDMAENLEAYDTSDYPTDHPLYSKKNVKLLGKMKDECTGQAPYEFVGVRSKMYSIRIPNNKAKFTAKEVSRKKKHFKTFTTCRLPTNATNDYDNNGNIYSTSINEATIDNDRCN